VVSKAAAEKALRLISQAWGPQSGYVFFPYIDREEQRITGERRKGFHEGPSFFWPKERDQIIEHFLAHTAHDLYWTAAIFEYPIRSESYAMDEYALWADLDTADPNFIDDYPPSIAWETSPGSFQGLWVAQRGTGSFQGASWPGNENQKLTYHVEADPSGWDTAQLLRVPGLENHKPEYEREDGTYPAGKILWVDGPRYELEDFSDLPELNIGDSKLTDALAQDIDAVDRLAVIARVKLKLNHKARELLNATDRSGDTSESLWYLIRCLADVGCSTAEIVAVVRETVWNKFSERHDELRRLIAEASKAIAKRSDETIAKLEGTAEAELVDRPAPERLGFLLKTIKKPKYIVKDILTEGACGFIAGEPKSYKSWLGLDLAFSVATGADFLGHFRVVDPGPVLYIQEEDPPATLKNRSAKIWVSKSVDKFELVKDEGGAGIWWLPPEQEAAFNPPVNAMLQKSFTISDEAWQLWLDETLAKGMDDQPYKLLIIDTLMMTAGEVEENKSQDMTNKIFRPLKVLSRKHNCAVIIIHHMAKSEKARPGQRMLGAVANHAWAEDSIYLSRTGGTHLRIDTESKTIPENAYRMDNVHNLQWNPMISLWGTDDKAGEEEAKTAAYRGYEVKKKTARDETLKLLEQGPMTTQAIAEARGVSRSAVHRQLTRHLDQGRLTRQQLPDGSNKWSLKE
jgi:hypothetical protein